MRARQRAIRWWADLRGTPTASVEGITRLRAELDAIVAGTAQATDAILELAEQVDQAAQTLAAGLRRDHERALASDVREATARIFHACQFHDLVSQRAGTVKRALHDMEDLAERASQLGDADDTPLHRASRGDATSAEAERHLLNGPRLAGDADHWCQDRIDALFDR